MSSLKTNFEKMFLCNTAQSEAEDNLKKKVYPPTDPNWEPDRHIEVVQGSSRPTMCWEKLQVKQTVEKVTPLPLDTPIHKDKVRFVCISDTHNRTDNLAEHIPLGDVLLHAGDFSMVGKLGEIKHFNDFLGTLPHRHKIVIAGNHDITFDPGFMDDERLWHNCRLMWGLNMREIKTKLKELGHKKMKEILTNCTYIEDSGVNICGIKIWGSPWQPEFGGWAFNLSRGQECLDKWNQIPNDTDILITHGPPIGHGDRCYDGQRAGCVELLNTIQRRVRPKYHLFGHIHEGYGITTDGFTQYLNASTCTLRYKASQPPILFDIDLPEGHSKEEVLQRFTSESTSEEGIENKIESQEEDLEIAFEDN